MGQAKVDPVDRARLIVLDHLTSECCKASLSAKSEVVTMSNDIVFDEPHFPIDALIRPRIESFEDGCASDEGSVFATVLVMIICLMLSVAIVNWCIFGR